VIWAAEGLSSYGKVKVIFLLGKNMAEEKNNNKSSSKDFQKLLDRDEIKVPQVGDIVKGVVISASKAEVRLDIDGILVGAVRGPELYEEADEYTDLKPGDKVEATVIEEENENGELELSFRYAGQERAWTSLKDAFENKEIIKIKIIDANKGGLLARFKQIQGFLPVSQLAPENYPRVSGGDKGKILPKLKSFIGKEFEIKVITLDEKEDKIIFSEKDVWSEKQKDVIEKYKIGTVVEGKIMAVTDFGVFVGFGDNMEGLIHISELAWQRIDDPADLFKVGDKIKAEVISLDGSKIFLSAKKLMKDPWEKAEKKYKSGQIVKGTILKVNPFGLFVKLDDDIHGLAHISQLGLAPAQKIHELFKANEKIDFEVMSIEPKAHRLGLRVAKGEVRSNLPVGKAGKLDPPASLREALRAGVKSEDKENKKNKSEKKESTPEDDKKDAKKTSKDAKKKPKDIKKDTKRDDKDAKKNVKKAKDKKTTKKPSPA